MTTMIKIDTKTKQVVINDGGHQHNLDLFEMLGGVSFYVDECKVYEDCSIWTRLRSKECVGDSE